MLAVVFCGVLRAVPRCLSYCLELPRSKQWSIQDYWAFLGAISRDPESIEYKILQRQVALKSIDDNIWSTQIKELLLMYNLPSIYEHLSNPPSKPKWQTTVKASISAYWETQIAEELCHLPSLKFLDCPSYKIGDPHLAITSIGCSIKDVRRVASRLQILTGSYPLNGRLKRACPLCGYDAETRMHFLLECPALDDTRCTPLSDIYQAAHQCNISQHSWTNIPCLTYTRQSILK